MSEIFTHSPFVQPTDNQPETGQQEPLVPPPPKESVEVVIRTMRSDIDQMKKGGMLEQRGLGITIPAVAPAAKSGTAKSLIPTIIWIVGVACGALLIFALGYFVLPALFQKSGASKDQAPAASQTQSPQDQTTPAIHQPTRFHTSFFSRPADAQIVLNLDEANTPAGVRQAITDSLLRIASSSALVEVLPQKNGEPATWNEMVGVVQLATPSENFWTGKYEDDFTMFVYRDKKGIWPGYILKRKSDQSALLVKNAMLQLEATPANLNNFFLTDPANPTGTFMDLQIGSQPFRRLSYTTPSAVFLYGWIYNSYFVISTSEDGFRRALQQF